MTIDGVSGPGRSPRVVVVGSLNFDLILQLPGIPQKGESKLATRVTVGAGGKGANQAAQAALLGAEVHIIGRVGEDEFGSQVLAALEHASVRLDGISRSSGTGLGVVWTDGRGGNWIVVAPRANAELTREDIDRNESLIAAAAILVVQLEVPVAAAEHAIERAAAHGVATVVNPSPARRLSRRSLRRIAVLVPNATEAEVLADMKIRGVSSAFAAGRKLRAGGPERVVITLGSRGSVAVGPDGELFTPPIPASPFVDPTGAGDAFCGALALAIAEGQPWADALRFASAAGSLCVRREGAMGALATRAEIEALLADDAKVRHGEQEA